MGTAATALAGLLAASALLGASGTASAVDLDTMKDGVSMTVGSASICADYMKKPEILDRLRAQGLRSLTDAGLSEADSDALMDEAIRQARAEPSNETQMQMACEFAGVKALPEPDP